MENNLVWKRILDKDRASGVIVKNNKILLILLHK
jgi:hypothetical protein